MVSGATQAGKTTMVCVLLSELDPGERIVTVEETFEIATRHPDTVGMQCRGASLDGVGEITLRRLVKEALRMRPTRLVVGEVRGDESLDLTRGPQSQEFLACVRFTRIRPPMPFANF